VLAEYAKLAAEEGKDTIMAVDKKQRKKKVKVEASAQGKLRQLSLMTNVTLTLYKLCFPIMKKMNSLIFFKNLIIK